MIRATVLTLPTQSARSSQEIAHWTGTTWQIETITWQGDSPDDLSLAINADGFPHVTAVVIMQYEPTSWVVEHQYKDRLAGTELADLAAAMAKRRWRWTQPGILMLATRRAKTYRSAFFDGAIWHSEGVDVSKDVGGLTSLAIDDSGRPVIAYSPGLIASWTGAAWTFDDFFFGSGDLTGVSLALGSDGQPHVAYSWHWSLEIFEETGLDYVFRDTTGWHSSRLYHGEHSARVGPPSLALAALDTPQLSSAIYDEPWPPAGPPYSIDHFRRTPSGWTRETVDAPGYTTEPKPVSLDLDPYGQATIGYTTPNEKHRKNGIL